MGGLVYNTWRGIATVKQKKSPSQPRTSRQLAIRSLLSTYSKKWQTLTQIQRDAWNTYALSHTLSDWTGNPKRITGMDWYVGCNSRLIDMGNTEISSPPTTTAPAAVTGLTLTPGSGTISCAFTAYAGTTTTVDLWLEGPYSPGRVAKIERAKHNAYQPGETTPKVISGLVAGYYTVFARGIDEASGLASLFVNASCTVS